MINGRTRLHVVMNGTMTGQRYIDEVLLPHVRLFRGAVGDKFVFMDDNATCHRTLAVQDCLDSEGIQRLVWPACSPDLNPIENVWDALGRQVADRNYPPTNKNTLIRALTEEWDKLPQQLLDNVVQSRITDLCIGNDNLVRVVKVKTERDEDKRAISRIRLGKGEGSTAIGKHFNLGESTVRAIKKNEAAIRKSVISGTRLSTKFASYRRDVLLERTERAIAIWIEEQVQRRIPVSGYLIQEKALQFYKSMKQSEPSTSLAGKEFSASKGWLTGFLKRNALHNIKITEESATVDEGAPKIFPEELAKIIEDGDYSADQVFNADETGLYWKKLPNRTYIAKDEKTASGHKASKDRVTLLLCSNASGDRMLKPLLINKSLRPRTLKGKDFKTTARALDG
ncbi:tigger transposable element-derived protein 1 [Trichonephila clavipes]|nr:tigger transposable element-derived protein 1 [Trichonephila clavipes]